MAKLQSNLGKSCSDLDKNQSVKLGDGADTVLNLGIRHLYQGAVGVLVHHGEHALPSHPLVALKLQLYLSTIFVGKYSPLFPGV